MQKIIESVKRWFRMAKADGVSPSERRRDHCTIGDHRYNDKPYQWWRQPKNERDDSEELLTFTGRHCKDCGRWDIAE